MKIKELIERLSKLNPETEVLIRELAGGSLRALQGNRPEDTFLLVILQKTTEHDAKLPD